MARPTCAAPSVFQLAITLGILLAYLELLATSYSDGA